MLTNLLSLWIRLAPVTSAGLGGSVQRVAEKIIVDDLRAGGEF